MDQQTEIAINIVRSSPLMDEDWYLKQYSLPEDTDVVLDYLAGGAEIGRDPGPFFSTKEYWENNPDVRDARINPLLHYEAYGRAEGNRLAESPVDKLREAYPELVTDLEHGYLRIRVTNDCNALCRFCGVRLGYVGDPHQPMDPSWYMELLRPVYEKVDQVLLTGGDPLITPTSYPLMEMLAKEYPQLTVIPESSGIAFTDRFQKLAADNLFMVHVSLNASDRHVYQDSVWEGPHGEMVYDRILGNLRNYVKLLEERDQLCFAPDLSMVINKDNYQDVVKFAALALSLKATTIGYYFDYTENDMSSPYFTNPDIDRVALRKLMEMERVLADKVMFSFRLWIPYKEAGMMQGELDAMTDEELREKYSDLLALAEGRSIEKEFEERNRLRREYGKRELTFDQDKTGTIRMEKRCGAEYCFAPWKELDLYPDGRLDFCGWYVRTTNLKQFLKDGNVDWNEVINSYEYMRERKKILRKDYSHCQSCCPMNDVLNPVVKPYEFGYGKLEGRKYGR